MKNHPIEMLSFLIELIHYMLSPVAAKEEKNIESEAEKQINLIF